MYNPNPQPLPSTPCTLHPNYRCWILVCGGHKPLTRALRREKRGMWLRLTLTSLAIFGCAAYMCLPSTLFAFLFPFPILQFCFPSTLTHSFCLPQPSLLPLNPYLQPRHSSTRLRSSNPKPQTLKLKGPNTTQEARLVAAEHRYALNCWATSMLRRCRNLGFIIWNRT